MKLPAPGVVLDLDGRSVSVWQRENQADTL
jgi:hypothetical protein